MARELRFGFGLHTAHRRASVEDWARRAEDMGYDVLHVPITALPLDDSGVPDLSITRSFLTDEQLLRTPGAVGVDGRDGGGDPAYRDTYGVTNIIVQQPHAEAFATVIAQLR